MLSAIVTSVVFTGGVGNVFAQETLANAKPKTEQMQHHKQDTKYSKKVMEAIRVALGEGAKSTQKDSAINKLPKTEVMDYYLVSFGKKLKGNEIRRAVEEVFSIDLNTVSKKDYGSKLTVYSNDIMESLRVSLKEAPTSKLKDEQIMSMTKNEVMDRYIKERDYALSGAASRLLINSIYGVNLQGISNLEYMQIAIHSKGQWIIKSDKDLFMLKSSLDDVDVSISTTSYFKEVTGSDQLPASLKNQFLDMGFTYIEETNLLYYKEPTGKSIPDQFKGQVIGLLAKTVASQYQK
ncbi:hypothetical protein B481_0625 [Planococcus halocryophilus Or1]|uniref:Uncharacterized protein n=2 Tax=Planococcus halocryophilus TaxID=1215089 RepID=A0A1C7DVM0_9BACL|nr:hypothetical protein [Planococcus halocryophilus]ANU15566.1 hypothetical protein BBI08_16050 [Planococcus halocryophilus]EMF47623.1 hypothetical protein B481_0625 [Planococcus halocryophilus Or1]